MFLPYQQTTLKNKNNKLFLYLKHKFTPSLRIVYPNHYLVNQKHVSYLEYIQKHSSEYNYFLKFDIEKYYPSIIHSDLIESIKKNYHNLLQARQIKQKHKTPPTICKRLVKDKFILPRKFQKLIEKDLPHFLNHLLFPHKGLPIGNSLSYMLAGIYLLDLDLNLPSSHLRYNDDYLVFVSKKQDINNLLEKKIIPILQEKSLKLNTSKTRSGLVHKDPIDFLGFSYKAGHFIIQPSRISKFKSKIRTVTDLRTTKEPEEVIKKINDKVIGFGHYYKYGSVTSSFRDLDAFIRKRLRRYIIRSRQYEKLPNLTLTNNTLEKMGLKSLVEIKDTFSKNTPKSIRKHKKRHRSSKNRNIEKQARMIDPSLKIHQKQVFEALKNITGSLEKIENRLLKIEEKLRRDKLL